MILSFTGGKRFKFNAAGIAKRKVIMRGYSQLLSVVLFRQWRFSSYRLFNFLLARGHLVT